MAEKRTWVAISLGVAAFALAGIILVLMVLTNLDRLRGKTPLSTGESGSAVVELIYEDGKVRHQPVADFNAFVKAAAQPVFVDFWAAWCGPCVSAAPFVESLSREYAGKAHVLKVDVDQAAALSNQFKIRSIPYFVVMKGGQIKDSASGYAASIEGDLRQMLVRQIG